MIYERIGSTLLWSRIFDSHHQIYPSQKFSKPWLRLRDVGHGYPINKKTENNAQLKQILEHLKVKEETGKS